ncbi:sensor histidine kinase [Tyzzerella sp. An114]|uniref:histidine kinase n=1 Tax=Tyzzerella sp. An114 TaxID=1965545 RepID=UPI000B5811D3|nr:histidine kinase [Tyzzerella sp. An114]OUQ59235.1 sensor histidine kinase [Tyzzerella sp. An114]
MGNKFRDFIEKISGFYRKKSIQYMLSLSFTIIAVVGFVFIGTSLMIRFSTANRKITEDYNKRIVDQVNYSLDSYIRNLMQVSNSMYYSVIKNTDLAEESLDEKMNLLYEANREHIVSIAVFKEDGQLVTATPLSKLKKTAQPQNEDWFQNATGQIENLHFSTPHVQKLFDDVDYKYKWVVSLSRAVELTTGGEIESGVLLVDMNFSGIEQICKNVNLGQTGYIYLIGRDGEIIYHPRQQLIYSNLLSENNSEFSDVEDGNYVDILDGQKRLTTVKTLGYTGWKIIGVTPINETFADSSQITIFILFVVFLAIILLVFANTFISAKIADPIKALENSVKELEKGAENVNIAIGGSYEIQHLGKTIKSMVEQMHKLMGDIVFEQELKRQTELDALQAQINPHFLYNTLDSIVWMVENERYQEAITMVTSLAGFFRISLSKGKNIITVKDELKHAENYITIQHMRFKDKFTFKINADEEVMDFVTIKLVIQPLIENAVYHGMEFMDGDGEIIVNAYKKDNELYIDVIDNGMGIPPEIAEQLLTKGSRAKGKGSGVGLKNVQERIQIYFGKEYGLSIISEPDEGTLIRIHLPCININEIYSGEGTK